MKYITKLYDDDGTLIAKISSNSIEMHESELHKIYDRGKEMEDAIDISNEELDRILERGKADAYPEDYPPEFEDDMDEVILEKARQIKMKQKLLKALRKQI